MPDPPNEIYIDLHDEDDFTRSVVSKPVDLPVRIAYYLSWSAFSFFLLAAAAMVFVVVLLYKTAPPGQSSKVLNKELAVLLHVYSGSLIALILTAIAAVTGMMLLRWARHASQRVIPPEDQTLLSDLITEEKDKAIDLYVRLSSLIGITGTFTRLGLVGLPLATIGLTLIFIMLSLAGNKDYMDLTKLTLGAFIGSYVQRQVTPSSK